MKIKELDFSEGEYCSDTTDISSCSRNLKALGQYLLYARCNVVFIGEYVLYCIDSWIGMQLSIAGIHNFVNCSS